MTASTRSAAQRSLHLLYKLGGNGALMITIVYVLMFAINITSSASGFSTSWLNNHLNSAAPLALAAAGLTLVILLGEFDLSLAGVISITNVVLAVNPLEGPWGALASLGIVMAIGLAVGIINGLLIAYLRVQSVAATLGTMVICQGVALLILSAPGGWIADWMVYELTDVLFGIIPVAGLILGGVALAWFIIKRTAFGFHLYAVGQDDTAAKLSGIGVRWTKFKAFCFAGIFYGLAGFVLSLQTSTGDPNSGAPLLLLSFAAVAIGGTAFSGGRGGVIGSIIGALVLELMQRMLFSLGVASFYTGLFQGSIMVLAVVFSAVMLQLSHKYREVQ